MPYHFIRINELRVLDVVFESELITVLETQQLDPWAKISFDLHIVGLDTPGSRPNVRKDLMSSAVKNGY